MDNITMEKLNSQSFTDIVLVDMPFDTFNIPSTALGLLKAEAVRSGLKAEVIYGNLHFAHFLGMDRYKYLQSAAGMMFLFVECIFEPFAGYDSVKSLDEIMEYYKRRNPGQDNNFEFFKKEILDIRESLDDYLEEMCELILKHNPKIVGSTYTMQQCNAILALFKRLKEKRPELICVMGGSSCSINAAQALVKYMPQVDYAFTGESDDIFATALRLMESGDTETLKKYPFVVQKNTVAKSHAVINLNDICYPDYDDYFKTLDELDLRKYLHVILPIEGSRGCWWGAKHKCKFCGLCNSVETLSYRMKEPKRVAEEVEYLHKKYGIKEFCFTDCILDPKHIKEFPALFKDKGYYFFAEVKSNTTYEDLLGIRQAGFIWLQPGIEALQDDLLIHMNKGNRAIKHIEYLKWARILGIQIFWNQLKGFPGEEDSWYYESAELFPLLTHLGNPNDGTFMYQRNSIFTIEQDKYGVHTEKCDYYEYLFGENEEFLEEFAEFFEDPHRKMPYAKEITDAVNNWIREAINRAKLTYFVDGDFMGIHDTRACAPSRKVVLMGLEKDICRLADNVISVKKLYDSLPEIDHERIDETLNSLIGQKLIIRIKDEILFLALPKGYEVNTPGVEYMAGRI